MYTSDINTYTRPAKKYLIAAAVIAAAAQVYGLFSHGVHSAFMTFAFAVPLILGALPYLTAEWMSRSPKALRGSTAFMEGLINKKLRDTQLAVIATLTAGSLLKGALDIYGTTNKLLIAYPLMAVAVLIAALAQGAKGQRRDYADEDAGYNAAE